MLRRLSTSALLLTALAAAQTPPPTQPAQQQQRDLKIEKIGDETTAPPKTPTIPRSYAVIIGISAYPKPGRRQLQAGERTRPHRREGYASCDPARDRRMAARTGQS
jgi:hypothetical protein